MSDNTYIIIVVFVCISKYKKPNKSIIFKLTDCVQSGVTGCLGILKKPQFSHSHCCFQFEIRILKSIT